MFKKGQLVRSRNTGELYVVGHDDICARFTILGRVNDKGVGPFSYKRPRRGLDLIGNNYVQFEDPRAWSAKAKLEGKDSEA